MHTNGSYNPIAQAWIKLIMFRNGYYTITLFWMIDGEN